jgi:hypothetical protein
MQKEFILKVQNFFLNNSYVVIKNHLNQTESKIFYEYCKNKVKSIDFKSINVSEKYDKDWDGKFGDFQTTRAYNCYGDTLMDTILSVSTNAVSNYTNIELEPTYSYWRFYQKNNDLKKHIDRKSCEISGTLCLGYDTSNLDDKNYCWPIYVEDKNTKKPIEIKLYPGDLLIYKGCDLQHWRENYLGLNHAQVFLHYNDKNDINRIPLDGRPMLGIPKKY